MKMLILALALLPAISFGAYKKPADLRFLLNQGYGAVPQLGIQVVDKKEHVLRAQWDLAKTPATTGSIELLDVDGKAAKIPVNAIVTDCLIHVKTAITLSSAYQVNAPYFAFKTGVDGVQDLKANVPASALSGVVACIPVGTAATAIRITTESTPILTITSASWPGTTTPSVATAGKINVLIKYILSE